MADEELIARRFPVDYDTIQKGDYFGPEQVEEWTGEKPGTAIYNFKMLKLCLQITQGVLDERGELWTLCIRDGGIAVLSDSDASTYNAQQFERHLNGLARSSQKMAAVDVAKLPDKVQVAHDQKLKGQGMVLASIAAARKPVKPIPVKAPKQLPEAGV